jgi:hypothetical protein
MAAVCLCISGFNAMAGNKTIVRPMLNGNRLDWCMNWSEDCGKPAADAFCRNLGFQAAAAFAPDPHIGWRTPTRLIGTGAICDLGHCDGFARITCVKQPTMADDDRIATALPRDRPEAADMRPRETRVATTGPLTLTPPVARPKPAMAAKPVLREVASVPQAPVADPPKADKPADGDPAMAAKPSEIKLFEKPMYNGKRLSWCHDFADGCGKTAADAFCQSNGFSKASDFSQDPHIGDVAPTRSMADGAVCDQAPCDGFKAITCAM